MYHYQIPFDELSLSVEQIFTEMGYGAMRPDAEVEQMICTLFRRVEQLANPSCAFAIYPATIDSSALLVDSGDISGQVTLNTDATIAGLMSGIDRVAIFTATAGVDFEQFQQELKTGGDILENFIVDTIGSCIAERAGDVAERHLEAIISPSQHTHRFSPGYCGWHLSEQRKVFSMLDPAPCGITLSEVCLMSPIKSISGFIGIGTTVNQKQYGCQFCELETCYKRKRKT